MNSQSVTTSPQVAPQLSRNSPADRGRRGLVGRVRRFCYGAVAPLRLALRNHAGRRAVLELNDHLLRDIGLERSQLTAAAYGRLNAAQRRAAACGQLGEGPLHMKKVSPTPTVDHAALVERLVIAGQESRR